MQLTAIQHKSMYVFISAVTAIIGELGLVCFVFGLDSYKYVLYLFSRGWYQFGYK